MTSIGRGRAWSPHCATRAAGTVHLTAAALTSIDAGLFHRTPMAAVRFTEICFGQKATATTHPARAYGPALRRRPAASTRLPLRSGYHLCQCPHDAVLQSEGSLDGQRTCWHERSREGDARVTAFVASSCAQTFAQPPPMMVHVCLRSACCCSMLPWDACLPGAGVKITAPWFPQHGRTPSHWLERTAWQAAGGRRQRRQRGAATNGLSI